MSLPIKDFSKSRPLVEPFNLNEAQLRSYKWFLENGLRGLFDEISPISDNTGKEFELWFGKYKFDDPKYDAPTARYKEATYEAALRVELRLKNLKSGKEQTQEGYLGDFPIMTERGTFIVNGVERVVVAQLIRSPGVYFTAVPWRGRQLFGTKVIPSRGAWLEFETDADGAIEVKIDRNRKVPVTSLLRVFGLDDEKIKAALAGVDRGHVRYLEATLKKDAAKNTDESYLEIYKRLRPGDPATPATAKNLIDAMFDRQDRYDISEVGRFKFNQRLDIDQKKKSHLIDQEDLLAIAREIIVLNNKSDVQPDDIDHLGNRRLKEDCPGQNVYRRPRAPHAEPAH